MTEEQPSDPITPTAQSAMPSTSPGGMESPGAPPDLLAAILAFQDKWESTHAADRQRMDSMRSGLSLLQGEMVVLQEDVKGARAAAEAARLTSEQAKQRAEEAHGLAEGATQATRFMSVDHEGDKEALLAALTETRGKLDAATSLLGELRKNDADLMVMVQEAAKNSAGAAIREAVGKNPKVVGAMGVIIVVLAQVLSQRFLLPPAAPNTGLVPDTTPTVHVEGKQP